MAAFWNVNPHSSVDRDLSIRRTWYLIPIYCTKSHPKRPEFWVHHYIFAIGSVNCMNHDLIHFIVIVFSLFGLTVNVQHSVEVQRME